MKWYQGHITPWWDDTFKNLDYEYTPLKNTHDLERWNTEGYAHINLNGQTVITGQPMPDWAEGFKTMFPWDNVGLVFFRMNTMDMLPMHMDSYTTYRKIFDIKDPSVIWRCVVFLEDWKSGHYLEIDDRLLPGWKAGDFILWNNDVPHFAGNFGTEPRYTMQITGMARS